MNSKIYCSAVFTMLQFTILSSIQLSLTSQVCGIQPVSMLYFPNMRYNEYTKLAWQTCFWNLFSETIIYLGQRLETQS